MTPKKLLEHKTPRWKSWLTGAPIEHRVEVVGVRVNGALWTSPNNANVTRIHLQPKEGWRIEGTLVEVSRN